MTCLEMFRSTWWVKTVSNALTLEVINYSSNLPPKILNIVTTNIGEEIKYIT